jgi:DNA-binding CsgD family transcriptional regulator/GTPase SAR1 family protein
MLLCGISYRDVMDEKQRHKDWEELTRRRRQVLEKFLAGKTDSQIAEELNVAEATVRKHFENIFKTFKIERPHQREDLKDLFSQYKPELLGESVQDTIIQEEVEGEPPSEITPMTGVVPLNSLLYIEREADLICKEALKASGNHQAVFIRIQGSRGLGKSSLLVRLQHWLKTEQKQIVGFVDLAGSDFAPEAFTDLDKLLYQFTYAISQSFSSVVPNLDLKDFWRGDVAAASNCTEYLEEYIFAKIKQPKTLIIDGIDKVLGRKETQTPFLNLLRSWYERKMKYVGQASIVWSNLAIASSTDPYPHYEMADSPLQNVGIEVNLREFDLEQIVDLGKRYKLDLVFDRVKVINKLIGGYPSLLNQLFYYLNHRGLDISQLEDQATGVFTNHLQKHARTLQGHEDLRSCFSKILCGQKCNNEFAKYQLELAGLIRGYPFNVQVSCELYCQFLTAHLELVCEE